MVVSMVHSPSKMGNVSQGIEHLTLIGSDQRHAGITEATLCDLQVYSTPLPLVVIPFRQTAAYRLHISTTSKKIAGSHEPARYYSMTAHPQGQKQGPQNHCRSSKELKAFS